MAKHLAQITQNYPTFVLFDSLNIGKLNEPFQSIEGW